MKKERRWLVDAIRTELLPELVRRGFEVHPLPKAKVGPTDRAFISAFPFGLMRRRAAFGFEQIEIQLAPRSQAEFRLNIGVVPYGGLEGIRGHIAADDAGVHDLSEFFALYSCPRFHRYFSVRRWWFSKRDRSEDEYRALVRHVVGLLPEVEQALRDGKIGQHIRHTDQREG